MAIANEKAALDKMLNSKRRKSLSKDLIRNLEKRLIRICMYQLDDTTINYKLWRSLENLKNRLMNSLQDISYVYDDEDLEDGPELNCIGKESSKKLPCTCGVLFSGLRPIPDDEHLDCPSDACYKCRKTLCIQGILCITECKTYCLNCGRKDVEIQNCPRCKNQYVNWLRSGHFVTFKENYPKCFSKKHRKYNFAFKNNDSTTKNFKPSNSIKIINDQELQSGNLYFNFEPEKTINTSDNRNISKSSQLISHNSLINSLKNIIKPNTVLPSKNYNNRNKIRNYIEVDLEDDLSRKQEKNDIFSKQCVNELDKSNKSSIVQPHIDKIDIFLEKAIVAIKDLLYYNLHGQQKPDISIIKIFNQMSDNLKTLLQYKKTWHDSSFFEKLSPRINLLLQFLTETKDNFSKTNSKLINYVIQICDSIQEIKTHNDNILINIDSCAEKSNNKCQEKEQEEPNYSNNCKSINDDDNPPENINLMIDHKTNITGNRSESSDSIKFMQKSQESSRAYSNGENICSLSPCRNFENTEKFDNSNKPGIDHSASSNAKFPTQIKRNTVKKIDPINKYTKNVGMQSRAHGKFYKNFSYKATTYSPRPRINPTIRGNSRKFPIWNRQTSSNMEDGSRFNRNQSRSFSENVGTKRKLDITTNNHFNTVSNSKGFNQSWDSNIHNKQTFNNSYSDNPPKRLRVWDRIEGSRLGASPSVLTSSSRDNFQIEHSHDKRFHDNGNSFEKRVFGRIESYSQPFKHNTESSHFYSRPQRENVIDGKNNTAPRSKTIWDRIGEKKLECERATEPANIQSNADQPPGTILDHEKRNSTNYIVIVNNEKYFYN